MTIPTKKRPSFSGGESLAAKLAAVATALLLHCWPAAAAEANCMASYYRTKLPGCVDDTLTQLRRTGPASKSDPSTAIGFLAQLFRTSPADKQQILGEEPSSYVRFVDLVALYRADLRDDARKFADKNQLSVLLAKLDANPPPALETVRPSANPADNDLLIGAYMASGDTVFIRRILENYSGADDATVSDGLRMAYMHSKFGPNLVATGRENVMVPAACAKYQCKNDPAKFLRVLTLSSAFWALQSLAQNDEGIKTTLAGFFDRDERLKNLLAAEQVAFGNYVTAITVSAVFKPDKADGNESALAMNKAASAYENLEPANSVFEPIEAFVKSGKTK